MYILIKYILESQLCHRECLAILTDSIIRSHNCVHQEEEVLGRFHDDQVSLDRF